MSKKYGKNANLRIEKGGLDQSQTKNELWEAFYNEPLGGVLKYENLCVKDTFEKNLKTEGHGINIWLSTPMLIDVHTKEKVQYLPCDSFNEISHSFTYSVSFSSYSNTALY